MSQSMRLSLYGPLAGQEKTKSEQGKLTSAMQLSLPQPSATAVSAQVARQRCPILCGQRPHCTKRLVYA
jgi:hypothetical protein